MDELILFLLVILWLFVEVADYEYKLRLRRESEARTVDEIVNAIVDRDGCSRADARRMVKECLRDCEDYIRAGDYDGVQELFMDELGLDPDYIECLF